MLKLNCFFKNLCEWMIVSMTQNNFATNDLESILFSEEDLSAIVTRLAAQITEDYKGKNLLLLSVLKGSILFMSDLMREIDLPVRLEFMSVSSYGTGVTSSGVVRVINDLQIDVSGYHILIVEDILDSGKTLSHLISHIGAKGAESVEVCTLFDKPERREAPVYPKYIGSEIPNAFIVGYGLDYSEIYRNLPYVGILKPSVYET